MFANTAITHKAYKIVILFGSPHKNGFTNALLNEFLEEYIPDLHHKTDIEYIYVYEKQILPCIDCGYCEKKSICRFNTKDQFDQIVKSVIEADILVIAAPVYFYGFPAPLKMIIDRFQQLYINHYEKENTHVKKGILIATCGQDNKEMLNGIKMETQILFKCLNRGFVRHVFAYNTNHPNKIKICD